MAPIAIRLARSVGALLFSSGFFVALAACAASVDVDEDGDVQVDDLTSNENGAGDAYQSFAELSAKEKEGVDFKVTTDDTAAKVLVLAIHGGKIEFATSEIARQLAGARDAPSPWDLYLFEGMKPTGNGPLHITSRRFDEPRAMKMAVPSDRCLSIHGFKNPDAAEICVGGLDEPLKRAILGKLAAFKGVSVRTSGGRCDGFVAIEPENIVNRCKNHGVQLEMSSKWRETLRDDIVRGAFVTALRAAVGEVSVAK